VSAKVKLPRGWVYRDEEWAAREAAEHGREVAPLYDYACECGHGHAFGPDVSAAGISKFLAEHEHGDLRLPPGHPEEERLLTEAQWNDHHAQARPGGPHEARLLAERTAT
jgi:hypothetical protein